jgi:hypothetical protein
MVYVAQIHRDDPGWELSEMELSDLILQLEEGPGPWVSEAVQTPENTGDLVGREGPTGRLFVPRERVLTDPASAKESAPDRAYGEFCASLGTGPCSSGQSQRRRLKYQ